MPLQPPRPGLRVVHNSRTAAKVEIVVGADDELTVPLDVAGQLATASTHFEVDPAELAAARKEVAGVTDESTATDATEETREPAPVPPATRPRKTRKTS